MHIEFADQRQQDRLISYMDAMKWALLDDSPCRARRIFEQLRQICDNYVVLKVMNSIVQDLLDRGWVPPTVDDARWNLPGLFDASFGYPIPDFTGDIDFTRSRELQDRRVA